MFERCLYFNLNALTRAVNQRWEEAYGTVGLSPAHAYLIRLVLIHPGVTQKQIAAELRLAASTITRFVDALVARGLLQRRDSAGDAREWTIHPTDAARALHSELERIGSDLFHELRTTLSAAERTELVDDLRKVDAALQRVKQQKSE